MSLWVDEADARLDALAEALDRAEARDALGLLESSELQWLRVLLEALKKENSDVSVTSPST